jgi:hypothetical protein
MWFIAGILGLMLMLTYSFVEFCKHLGINEKTRGAATMSDEAMRDAFMKQVRTIKDNDSSTGQRL